MSVFVRTLVRPMSGLFWPYANGRRYPKPRFVRHSGCHATSGRVRVGSEFFAKVCDGFQLSGTCGDCRPRETPVVWINGCLSSKTPPRNLVGCRSTVSNFHRYVFDVPACPVAEFPTKFNGIHKSPDRGKAERILCSRAISPFFLYFSFHFYPIYILLLLLLPSVVRRRTCRIEYGVIQCPRNSA